MYKNNPCMYKNNPCIYKILENQGIDPCASCMLSTRSTIWARSPVLEILRNLLVFVYDFRTEYKNLNDTKNSPMRGSNPRLAG